MAKRTIKRPTEDIALGRWTKSHLVTKPTFWPEHPQRFSLIKQNQGNTIIGIPVLFGHIGFQEVFNDGGFVGYVKTDELMVYINSFPHMIIKEYVI